MLDLDVVLADPNNPYSNGALSGQLLEGVGAAVIDGAQRQKYGFERAVNGLVVVSVAEDSAYAETLAPGIVIA
ncbi:MAG: hypothetical protein ACI9ZV_000124 [Candidatus Azotimanducaceae bacterium]